VCLGLGLGIGLCFFRIPNFISYLKYFLHTLLLFKCRKVFLCFDLSWNAPTPLYPVKIGACRDGSVARSQLFEMRREGIIPDVMAWSAVVAACDRGGQSDLALQLLDEMRAAGVEPNQ